MTEEQKAALATMNEWRDALDKRVESEEDRNNGDVALWFALMAIRNVMNDVSKAFGMGSFTETAEAN